MYQFSYAEIMEDGVADSKDRERQVLNRSMELLALARASTRPWRPTSRPGNLPAAGPCGYAGSSS